MKHKIDDRGVSLLLTILIMAAILVIAFGVSRLTIGEIKLGRDISKSIVAYYTAEAGIEATIYRDRVLEENLDGETINGCLDEPYPGGNICYQVEVNIGGDGSRTIKSNGSYKDTRRTVEITY